MTIYRVFLRSGRSILCHGEQERDAAMARDIPRAILWEIAAFYRCQHCGHEAPWAKGWVHYFVHERIEAQHPGATPIGDYKTPAAIFCSDACQKLGSSGYCVPRWSGDHIHQEPRYDRKANGKLWAAKREAKEAGIRKFPMPQHPKDQTGIGWCRWCGGRIIEKNGQPSKRRTWHAGCLETYFVHTRLDAQRAFLAERDGRKCAECGTPGLGEVDHKIPLWKVQDLPDEERRKYFGPENIWALCLRCHQAKTAKEAAERARLRKSRRKS